MQCVVLRETPGPRERRFACYPRALARIGEIPLYLAVAMTSDSSTTIDELLKAARRLQPADGPEVVHFDDGSR